MRFLIRDTDNGYECVDEDQPTECPALFIGQGTSPDEALGAAVRNAWLMYDEITVEDISHEEQP